MLSNAVVCKFTIAMLFNHPMSGRTNMVPATFQERSQRGTITQDLQYFIYKVQRSWHSSFRSAMGCLSWRPPTRYPATKCVTFRVTCKYCDGHYQLTVSQRNTCTKTPLYIWNTQEVHFGKNTVGTRLWKIMQEFAKFLSRPFTREKRDKLQIHREWNFKECCGIFKRMR